MQKPPEGWPRISSAVFCDDPGTAIDWLCQAFGFEVRLRIEGDAGRIEHSELTFGEGLISVGSVGGKSSRQVPLPCGSPRPTGGINTQALCVVVDDVDAHAERAKAAGATILRRAGLVEETGVEDDARARLYQLRPERFGEVRGWLDEIEAFWGEQLRAFKAHAEKRKARR